jgi:hypothetical protein
MELRFQELGDALGSRGRFNTRFHVRDRKDAFPLDCGASSMIAIRKSGIDLKGEGDAVIRNRRGPSAARADEPECSR